VSIAVKTCSACGQVNPAFHAFCPVCGASLSDTARRAAPWTVSSKFPPLAAAVDPDRTRRRRQTIPEGRGVGLAWIGAIFIAIPVLASPGSRLALAGWGAGIFAIIVGFWQMRRDPHTLAKAGFVTQGAAIAVLAIIGMKVMTTGHGLTEERPAIAIAATPTSTSVPDWAGPTSVATYSASVTMYRGDAAHTGELPGPGISGRPYRLWRFDSSGELYSSPAVVDGMVFVGTKAGFVFALDSADGSERWRKELGNYIVRSSPAVIDGKVYIGAGYTLFALDAKTGQETWHGSTSFSGSSSPTFADGTIYVASQSSTVYAFDATSGKQRWSFPTDGPIFSSPAVSGSLVFVGTDNGKLLALSTASGQAQWRAETQGGIYSSPAVAGDFVYVTTKAGKTYAYNIATGQLRWSYDAGGEASPVVANGILYVAGADGGLYALDAAHGGDPKWLFPTGSPITVSPTVADGIVYVASGTTLYAIDAATGAEHWRYAAGYRIETSPIVVNGMVFIGGDDGYLDAIKGDGTS
jgi:outer membrane protein assembly factor BamB